MPAALPVSARNQPSGSRHPWNARLCDRLERMAWGHGAKALSVGLPRARLGVGSLPVFAWDVPHARVGRKSLSHDGGQLVLPIRVRWYLDRSRAQEHIPEVILVPVNGSIHLRWEASGAGHNRSGKTMVTATAKVSEPVFMYETGTHLVPYLIYVPVLSRVGVISHMQEMVADGRLAQWEAISEIESHLSWAFERANAAVRHELLGGEGSIDAETKAAIKDAMMFGDPGRPTRESYVLRLLDRCLKPGVFERVDPQRYVMTALVSGSETAIRRHLGDPHIGRKIRRLRQEREWASADDLLAEYRRRYPKDTLGSDRVEAALTADLSVPHLVPYTDEIEYSLRDADD